MTPSPIRNMSWGNKSSSQTSASNATSTRPEKHSLMMTFISSDTDHSWYGTILKHTSQLSFQGREVLYYLLLVSVSHSAHPHIRVSVPCIFYPSEHAKPVAPNPHDLRQALVGKNRVNFSSPNFPFEEHALQVVLILDRNEFPDPISFDVGVPSVN